jgi:exopolysaccharide biosynthesis polyprenyl glycosylphosphotransferase
MLREHYILFRRLHLIADLTTVICCYFACCLIWDGGLPCAAPADLLFAPELLIPTIIFGIMLSANHRSYEYRFRSLSSALWGITRTWLSAVMPALVVLFLYEPWVPDRAKFLVFALSGIPALGAVRSMVWLALHFYRRSGRSFKNVLIIGTGKLARLTADHILSRPGQGLRILGFLDWEPRRRHWRYRDIPVIGSLPDLPVIGKSQQMDLVVFAVGYKSLGKISGVAQICGRMGLPTIVLTDVLGDSTLRREPGRFFGRPGVCFDPQPRQDWTLAAKSLLDRALAGAALVVLTPFLAMIALALKWASPGPVFFKQRRVGLNGRQFTLWKFRTMIVDAEKQQAQLADSNEMSGPVFKMKNDPRVTRIGRFLRRTSIDELPQLINVARGDMSLVGPRPPLPEEVRRYDGWERRRLSVRPGLTCLWQIGGRNRIDFEEWMKLDLEYIDNWSLKKDAEILVKTIPAVFRGTGAH